MERCSMYFRISTSESVWIYYMLTLRGTVFPTNEEIKNSTLRDANNH